MKRPLLLVLVLMLAACGKPEAPADGVQEPTAAPELAVDFEAVAQADGELSGEQLLIACSGCHSLRADEPHRVGPNLHGIAGQPAGTRPEFGYSPALAAAGADNGLVWEKGSLMAWVIQTEGMVPGTWMLYYNSLSGAEVQRLVDYILSETP